MGKAFYDGRDLREGTDEGAAFPSERNLLGDSATTEASAAYDELEYEPKPDAGVGGTPDGNGVVGFFSNRRQELVRRQVKTWRGQLIDLGGRNNLLYYRDLKQGTLDLAEASERALADLLANKTVKLSKLFPDAEDRAAAVRRVRTIRNKAQENFEERGLQTLYLACGMATWENNRSAATPQAPVLLRSATIAADGAAQEDFSLALTGEMEVNPTFLHLLETDFQVKCSLEELDEQIDGAIDEHWEIDKTYGWLRDRADRVPGFEIIPRFIVGNFAYAKLPMVQDLEGSVEELIAHDLIAAIAGDEEARAKVREASGSPTVVGPDHVPLADEFLVLDADSSQNYVINAAVAGASLIVEGPPGTGKSQTIANLIATLVARGQKVLFVAEKRAAIDAVLKRLQKEGLDDLMLDLHGGSSSRRLLAQNIAKALHNNGRTPQVDHRELQQKVEGHRAKLNDHDMALHDKRQPWGISVYDAQAQILGISPLAQTDIRFRGDTLQRLDGETFRALVDQIGTYAGLGGVTLPTSESPWAAATVTTETEARSALEVASRLRQHTLPNALVALRAGAQETGADEPESLERWQQLVSLWRRIHETLGRFSPEVYEVDLDNACAALAPAAGGAISRLGASLGSREFRQGKRDIRAFTLPSVKLSAVKLLHGCEEAREQLAAWREIADDAEPSPPTKLDQVEPMLEQLQLEVAELARVLSRDDLARLTTTGLDKLLERLLQEQTTLAKLPEIFRLETSLTKAGLAELLDEARAKQLARDLCVDTLRYAWLQSVLEHVRLADPTVGAFDADDHDHAVHAFRNGDREHIESTSARVRRLAAERATRAQDEHKNAAALLQQQASRKRGHLPVRQLFEATSEVLLELKPCWVMSPLVVSQLLPARKYFDVVVFDEASQVPPADAIPAILRGSRLIVAGDKHQLPPTTFFASQTAEEEESEEEAPIEGGVPLLAGTEGTESILEALESLLPPKTLEWHYRSHDERLIAFSNSYIYDRMLTTFPGTSGDASPVSHVLVPWTPGKPGEDQSSSAEVERAVELILAHARERPDESLGVIAMGIKHANRIDEALRRALHDHPDLDEFFDETKSLEDRFFIKNLERVQGDERDAIILSVGYGKNEQGKLYYRFGPLLYEGGERRLNVAITRARKHMTLISSFDHTDMDPDRSSAEGVKLLRLYLQYAASGGANLGEAALEAPQLNPFEISVRDSLTRAGIPLVAQYGCSGYRIDFVAKHRQREGRMVLAIECDGATYHSSQSARDRDRLRQDMLERLGWHFHRIWSSDWFYNRDIALKKALDAYEEAVTRADEEDGLIPRDLTPPQPNDGSADSGGTEAVKVHVTSNAQREGRVPVEPGYTIDSYSLPELVRVVQWVESDGLLRTEDELLDQVMSALWFERRGKKIVAAITDAIRVERDRGRG
jgi:very-short-patch-repair endonuclease